MSTSSTTDIVTTDGGSLDIVLVKIGGSSITNKAELESINQVSLDWFAKTVSEAVHRRFLRPSPDDQKVSDDPRVRAVAFVLVHGAGSFGHFAAKEYGLRGHDTHPDVDKLPGDLGRSRRRGLAETRLSVQTLNKLVVSALLDHGVNAVGISPCFGIPGLEAHAHLQKDKASMLETLVKQTVEADLVPVIHGDAGLYGGDCGILSGDSLMEIFGTAPWVHNAIFITDVDGVFSEDPRSNPGARLLPHLTVDMESGEITTELTASSSSHEHDVTGGLTKKLKSAATIASSGAVVTVVKCGSQSAEQALQRQGEIEYGTVISPREQ